MSLINRCLRLIKKVINCLGENGLRVTWSKVKRKISQILKYRPPLYTKKELEAQKHVTFPQNIKFSVLVPVFNTPEKYLREMIESVEAQTYANWELCIADGSDSEHTYVGDICREYASGDSRILYQKLEENMGISGNTNVCIDMASGDYISLFDHDDILHPAALYANMKAICEKDADFIYTDENTFHNTPRDAFNPHFKPDYAPDTLRSNNYITHFTVFKKDLLKKSGGGFRSEFDGSQDYDLILRLTEKANKIVHIPQILYYWRSHPGSVADDISAKPYAIEAGKKAVSQQLYRLGLKGEVLDARIPTTYRIAYEIAGNPLISILIPNKDHADDLKKCIDSIAQKSTYNNWEIIIIENNSSDNVTFDYYEELRKNPKIKIVTWNGTFNYSAINNYGAKYASGEHLLLLNNDTEVITPDWMEQMLMYSQRKDVGAVGAMLYYPDNTVQHAGVIIGMGGVAGHYQRTLPRGENGYMNSLTFVQNYSAVTGACIMMRHEVWDEIGGLDEAFKVAFNDVDMCMRIRKIGYLGVWTPFAELYHYESKSCGLDTKPKNRARFAHEVELFHEKWQKELDDGDPYYNENLSLY